MESQKDKVSDWPDLHVRIPPHIFDRLCALARLESRTVTAQARVLLTQQLEESR